MIEDSTSKLEIVTSWETLMIYARELGKARLSGDEQRIEEAQQKHDEYRDACLRSDRMIFPFTIGNLSDCI